MHMHSKCITNVKQKLYYFTKMLMLCTKVAEIDVKIDKFEVVLVKNALFF